MPDSKPTRARLRTKSGCNYCREQRKKCDEHKLSCQRCIRSHTSCTWPSQKILEQDGRRERGFFSRVTGRKPPPRADVLTAWSASLMELQRQHAIEIANVQALSLDLTEESGLFLYCFNHLLPSVIQRTASTRYSNFNYWRMLAVDHPPLADIAIACAALSISYEDFTDTQKVARMRRKALTYQTSAIIAVRDCINSGAVDGSENWLLATINCMMIFEGRDPDSSQISANVHLKAMTQLFKRRESQRKSLEVLSFSQVNYDHCQALKMERICYESLLHHGAIAMLYDNGFNSLVDSSVGKLLEGYFCTSPLPSDSYEHNWPILGISYKLFRLVIAVLKLMHINSLSRDDLEVGEGICTELTQWIGEMAVGTTNDPTIAMLYLLTAKALLEHILQPAKDFNPQFNLAKDVGQCFRILSLMETRSPLGRYHLWPLGALGYISRDEHDVRLVKEKKDRILVNMNLRESL